MMGMPDLSKVTAEFRQQTGEILALLTEVRDLLRQMRDQRDAELNGPRS